MTKGTKEEMLDRIMEKAMPVKVRTLDLEGLDFDKFMVIAIETIEDKNKRGIHLLGAHKKFTAEMLIKDHPEASYYVIEVKVHEAILAEYGHDPEGVRDEGNHKKKMKDAYDKLDKVSAKAEAIIMVLAIKMEMTPQQVKNLFVLNHVSRLGEVIGNNMDDPLAIEKYFMKLAEEL